MGEKKNIKEKLSHSSNLNLKSSKYQQGRTFNVKNPILRHMIFKVYKLPWWQKMVFPKRSSCTFFVRFYTVKARWPKVYMYQRLYNYAVVREYIKYIRGFEVTNKLIPVDKLDNLFVAGFVEKIKKFYLEHEVFLFVVRTKKDKKGNEKEFSIFLDKKIKYMNITYNDFKYFKSKEKSFELRPYSTKKKL